MSSDRRARFRAAKMAVRNLGVRVIRLNPCKEDFIRLRRRPRPWPWRNAFMRDIPFRRSMYHASADFAHRRMTHRSLGVGGYGFWGPRACPWGSIRHSKSALRPLLIKKKKAMVKRDHNASMRTLMARMSSIFS